MFWRLRAGFRPYHHVVESLAVTRVAPPYDPMCRLGLLCIISWFGYMLAYMHAMPCHAMPRHAMSCHVIPYHTII